MLLRAWGLGHGIFGVLVKLTIVRVLSGGVEDVGWGWDPLPPWALGASLPGHRCPSAFVLFF